MPNDDDTVRFSMNFKGPFHVLTGSAGNGNDETVDLAEPVPESSVKGAMRAAAVWLSVSPDLIDDIFGTPRRESPWAWEVGPLNNSREHNRVLVPIDEESGTARSGAIRFAEELWATSIGVEIYRHSWVPADQRRLQQQVLRAAARALISIGSDRNRGFGWIHVTEPTETPESIVELATLILSDAVTGQAPS